MKKISLTQLSLGAEWGRNMKNFRHVFPFYFCKLFNSVVFIDEYYLTIIILNQKLISAQVRLAV